MDPNQIITIKFTVAETWTDEEPGQALVQVSANFTCVVNDGTIDANAEEFTAEQMEKLNTIAGELKAAITNKLGARQFSKSEFLFLPLS